MSAFQLSGATQTEEEFKPVFLSTNTQIGERVDALLRDSLELGGSLNKIQQILDRLKVIAVTEVGDLTEMGFRRTLWSRLARASDYDRYKFHETLLTDIIDLYTISSDIVRETIAALNRVQADLTEFGHNLSTPGLTFEEQGLEVTIELLAKSGRRLKSAQSMLDSGEMGQPAQRHDMPARPRTRTVTATLV
jgi:hypothetical protein